MSNNTRIEENLLGTREAPADAYYGVCTLRAIENFYISGNKINDIPEFVRGMVMVKKAAAVANKELQAIPKSATNAIIVTCDEILNSGKCMGQFPVDVYQGGADTSANMNTNEVLANIGLELMGHQKGEYQYLNPDDHVNRCRSTNGAYPTGFRIAVYPSLIRLVDAISQLRKGFECKAVEFQNILKVGHTQLQDAVPITLGQKLRAFSILLKEKMRNIQHIAELLLEVSLGVTAIGASLNTPKEYSPLTVKKLTEATGFPRVPAEGLVEATSDCGAYAIIHDVLKRLAMKMSKICDDLHLLSSSPHAGLNEINPLEPQVGSSVVPTKVSLVVPEVTNQICLKAIGNDTTVIVAVEVGQLQLNAMESVIGQAMFEPIHILTSAYYDLLEKYANGITTNKEVCEDCVYSSVGIVTYLNPFIGRHNGGIMGRICAETGRNVHEVVLEHGLSTGTELGGIFSAQNPMYPVYKTKRYTDKNGQ